MPDVHLSFASIITDDIVGLSNFYADLLGLEEVVSLRSEHFRGLAMGETILGFSTPKAYELLNLRAPAEVSGTVQFLTFEVPTEPEVDTLTAAATAAGAQCVAAPQRTYYGAWQSVLLDPKGNAFRVNHLGGDHLGIAPHGVDDDSV
ncbi:VOC family protein [Gordonia polyisoprenivorans]|uniref:VOC family protein n=1 Tax=Gordonia polyisoprenivorans TaxID=84595 RepID=UPI001AD60ADB|nr:VOC family protein [Gordonia polyisoprenivorans]QTI68862.1 VOC family protein [Gordonia polyisoprenivorans]